MSKQEPVAWYHAEDYKTHFTTDPDIDLTNNYWQPLYTSPQQREWQGLTDEEIEQIVDAHWNDPSMFVEAIEATLKAKNALPSPR